MAASFEVAGRDRGFAPSDRRRVVLAAAREYRLGLRQAAEMTTLDVWYSHMEIDEMLEWIRTEDSDKRLSKEGDRRIGGGRGQGPDPGQPPGVPQTHRAGRR